MRRAEAFAAGLDAFQLGVAEGVRFGLAGGEVREEVVH